MPESPAAGGRQGRLWRNEYLWAALVIGALTLLFFNPFFRFDGSLSAINAHQRGSYPWVKPTDPPYFTLHDQADYVYPRQVFLDRSLKQDHDIPLWNPLQFAGHPFFAETGSRMAYPPFAILTLLFRPIVMHDIYLMVHIFAAGMAMFALMKQLRAGFAGSLLAGVAWAFSSYGLLYYVLEMYPAVAALLPLVVLGVHRWDQRRSWPPLLGAGLVLGLLYLGTSAELAFMSFLFAGAYAGCLALRRILSERRDIGARQAFSLLGTPGVLLGVAAGVAAVGILPFVDLSARSGRTSVSYPDIMKYFPHVRFGDFARVFFPPDAPLSLQGVSQQVFLGTAVGVLALAGLVSRRPGSAMARGLLVTIFLFAIGGPGTWLAYHLPGINKLHGVGRSFFLFNLGLAVLAGIGLDRVVGRIRRVRATEVGASPAGSVLSGAVAAICVVVTFQQLFTYGRGINPPFQRRDASALLPPTPATEAVRAVLARSPGGGRVLPLIRQGVDPALGYTLPAATGMALDLPVTGGYEPVLPERVATMWRLLTGEPLASVTTTKINDTALNAQTLSGLARVDLLPRLGVAAVLGPPTMTEAPGWDRVAAAKRGLRVSYAGPDGVVYEVVDRVPRAFVVHNATSVTADQALARLDSAGFDIRGEVLLEGAPGTVAPAPAGASTSTVQWLDDDADEVALSVNATRDGWLVLLDSWDPGWRATVDGRAAPVLRADYGFRAVRIGSGTSTVRFSYRPTPVYIGAVVSTLTTSAVIAILVAGRVWRRRRRAGGGPDDDSPLRFAIPTVTELRDMVRTPTGRRLRRYFAASVVNVALGEVVLAIAFGLFGWSARSASVLAAVVAAGPAYLLARRWVWGRSGRSHLIKEVLPFWTLALLGLGVTTLAAGAAEEVTAGFTRLTQTAVVMAAVLGASAVFWVVRFVVLNRVLFADRSPLTGRTAGPVSTHERYWDRGTVSVRRRRGRHCRRGGGGPGPPAARSAHPGILGRAGAA